MPGGKDGLDTGDNSGWGSDDELDTGDNSGWGNWSRSNSHA